MARLLLAAIVAMAVACEVPGLKDIDEKIDTLGQRLEALEDLGQQVPEIDLSRIDEVEQRLLTIEESLASSGIEVSTEVPSLTGIEESIAQLQESLSTSTGALEDLITGQQDSIAVLRVELAAALIQAESLAARVEELEDDVSWLAGQVSSSSGSSGTSGRGGGTGGSSGGRTGGTSGGRSGGTSGGSSGGSSGGR
jgi:chromosome segregation ATPase